MGVAERAAFILRRSRPAEVFPPLAVDPETNLIFLDGGYLGAVWTGPTLSGVDEIVRSRLQAALNLELPAGSVAQFHLLSSQDVDPHLGRYAAAANSAEGSGLRQRQRETLVHATQERVELLRRGRYQELIPGNPIKINRRQVIVALKVPCEKRSVQDQVPEVAALMDKWEESLRTAGLHLRRLDGSGYLQLLRRILKPDQPLDARRDPDRLLREQITAPGDQIEIERGIVRINEVNAGVLSIKHLPKQFSLANMIAICGDPNGIENQLGIPHMVTLTVEYPDRAQTAARVRRTSQALNYQAFGGLSKFAPKILLKKEGLDVMVRSLDEGDRPVRINLSTVLFSKDVQELRKQLAMLRTFYVSLDLETAEERHLTWPMFWTSLPLFPDPEALRQTFRMHTMSYRHAAQFLPVLGEWPGTGTGGAMLLQSRQGQPVLVDLYDSASSFSAMVFAESGAGKSVLTQRMILDYLRQGARVFVIDVGYSYYKLARYLDGEYIEFTEESGLCLNPFTHVEDIDEELESVKALLAKMAAPTEGLDDFRLAALEEAIKAVWGRLGNAMTVTAVADFLLQQADQRIQDMGRMLFPFTRNGSHGPWFEGANTLDFRNNLVVLELEQLKSKKGLQQVVLLQLISRIQQEMFLRADGRPCFVILDEAWDLLSDEETEGGSNMVARFMETGYRRARKANGAFVIVTQSLSDAYRTASGRAMAANSPHKFVLCQSAESIEALSDGKMLSITPGLRRALRSVHTVPEKYAEMVVMAGDSWGVARLVESPFMQALFSTKGAARTEIIEAIRQEVAPVDAVEQFLARQARGEMH